MPSPAGIADPMRSAVHFTQHCFLAPSGMRDAGVIEESANDYGI